MKTHSRIFSQIHLHTYEYNCNRRKNWYKYNFPSQTLWLTWLSLSHWLSLAPTCLCFSCNFLDIKIWQDEFHIVSLAACQYVDVTGDMVSSNWQSPRHYYLFDGHACIINSLVFYYTNSTFRKLNTSKMQKKTYYMFTIKGWWTACKMFFSFLTWSTCEKYEKICTNMKFIKTWRKKLPASVGWGRAGPEFWGRKIPSCPFPGGQIKYFRSPNWLINCSLIYLDENNPSESASTCKCNANRRRNANLLIIFSHGRPNPDLVIIT